MADNLAETGLQSWSIYTAADEADKGVERLRAPPKGLYKTSSTFPRLRELKTHTVHWQTMAILPTQRPSTGRVPDPTTWDLLKSVMREAWMWNLLRFIPFQSTRYWRTNPLCRTFKIRVTKNVLIKGDCPHLGRQEGVGPLADTEDWWPTRFDLGHTERGGDFSKRKVVILSIVSVGSIPTLTILGL